MLADDSVLKEGDSDSIVIFGTNTETTVGVKSKLKRFNAEEAENPTDDAHMVFGDGVILQAPQKLWNELENRIKILFPEVTVHPPLLPPEYGAALMAAFHAGAYSTDMFRQTNENYDNRQN